MDLKTLAWIGANERLNPADGLPPATADELMSY